MMVGDENDKRNDETGCKKGNDGDGTEGDNNDDNIAIFFKTRQDGEDNNDHDDAIMNLLIFVITRRGAVST